MLQRGRNMGDFRCDVRRIYAAFGADPPKAGEHLRMWVCLSELHAVACYRLGQYARVVHTRYPGLGWPLLALHSVWNRCVTHVDHCEISRGARIGPGFLVMHRHGLVIGPATIGKNFVVHQNVTIGQRVAGGNQGVPHIGDNVWVGPGAVLTGSITVGDGATISAGTVLSKSVPARCLVAGNPGRVIAHDYDNSAILNAPGIGAV